MKSASGGARRFFRVGAKILGGVVGVVSASGFAVSYCAAPLNDKKAETEGGVSGRRSYVSGAGGGGPPDFIPTRPWNFNWDWRDPRVCQKSVWSYSPSNVVDKEDSVVEKPVEYPKARRRIVLVRHGQYNQKGNDDKAHTLTTLGREQAALAGKRLKSTGIKWTSIVSSGMTRAKETAEIIAQEIGQDGLKVEVHDELLNEGAPCIPEPPYPNPELWSPDFSDFYEEGARIEAAFRKYIHRADLSQKEDSYELIVCHGNVIRYFSMRAMQFPPEGWLRLAISHTSLTTIRLDGDGNVVMKALGDSGHLPFDKDTC